MSLANNEGMLITKMIKLEVMIGQLYFRYAEIFSEYEKFWHDLGVEEKKHSSFLAELLEMSQNKKLYINMDKFKVQAVETIIEGLSNDIDSIDVLNINMRIALGTALNYENSMIEKEFYNVFESDSVEVKQTFMVLDAANKMHRDKINSLLNEIA